MVLAMLQLKAALDFLSQVRLSEKDYIAHTHICAILLSTENALACTCGYPQIDTEEKFRPAVATAVYGADAILSGKVVAMDRLTVKFKLEKVWKGDFKEAE